MLPGKLSVTILVYLILSLPVLGDDPPTLQVWPGDPPGENGKIGPEKVIPNKPGDKKIILLTNVTRPTITLYRPDKRIDTGMSVLICPGGAYHILAWDLEGVEVAQWLNKLGITGIVLKYRVPRRPGTSGNSTPPQPLMDAQRALSFIRSKAKEWNLDPNRVGILGFSAGGHLSAAVATNFDKRAYQAIDEVDTLSCKPDFAVLIYPAYLLDKKGGQLAPDIRVTGKTPPTFFAHAGDDGVSAENSAQMYLALKKAKVPAELHIYAKGGHGFGLRQSNDPCSTWPNRCEEWFRTMGWLKTGKE